MKGVPFLLKMVYKRVIIRIWTFGRTSPYKTFCPLPTPPVGGGGVIAFQPENVLKKQKLLGVYQTSDGRAKVEQRIISNQ